MVVIGILRKGKLNGLLSTTLDISDGRQYVNIKKEMIFESFPFYKSSLEKLTIKNDEILRCSY